MQDSVAGWLLTFTCIGLSPTRFTKLNLAHTAFYLRLPFLVTFWANKK
jgi:hypothetical protein